MSDRNHAQVAHRQTMNRRDFLRHAGWGGVGVTGLLIGARLPRALAHPPSVYPSWTSPSDQPPKRGGVLTRASAWDLDERTYQYMHSKSPKNYFRVDDPVIDELATSLRRTPDRAEQRALTRKIVEREHDQVLRMWMPFDAGFSLWQPHLRNVGQLDMRGNFGYGSSTLARLWLDR